MIKFFRLIRKDLMQHNKTGKYLKYAIGEIILVVIGILIALQINNWNNNNLDREREKKYLLNVVSDLEKDILNLNSLITFRKQRLKGDAEIIKHINGKPIDDLNIFTGYIINSVMERKFAPNNTAFNELISSGNLNIIQNDSIKQLLLELQKLYKENDSGINHETFDYQEYISKPINNSLNLNKLMPVYYKRNTAAEQNIEIKDFESVLSNAVYKNGLVIMTIMSNSFINNYERILHKSQRVIDLAHIELKAND